MKNSCPYVKSERYVEVGERIFGQEDEGVFKKYEEAVQFLCEAGYIVLKLEVHQGDYYELTKAGKEKARELRAQTEQ